ncbi:hypothetical protein BDD43_0931 [Mucilaginibacter gracilis]|uniref:Uncharacterized protein n=1 Tax=Mucilaginibacter gracilis TaxID=423350 RepID=A0A495IVM2_9SPHI|nr:hypothetical protein BDD43_0931 [Mucilaginibacter gracilis]
MFLSKNGPVAAQSFPQSFAKMIAVDKKISALL